MSPRPALPPGPYLIVGLARSGLAARAVLEARGQSVSGYDARDGGDGIAALEHVRTAVKSPGVPREAPVIATALERGLVVIGELELAWRLLPNEFIAVTGTNGKTTTVEMIGHVHREAGLPVVVAGNVGTPLSSLVGVLAPGTVVVCECSSFQLEDTVAFAPEAAVLLGISPDHLDRHGTFEAYRDAKLRIFANQGNDDLAVSVVGLKVGDLGGCARRVCFGPGALGDLDIAHGQLWWDQAPLMAAAELRVPGAHNVVNAAAAAAVCLARGIDRETVAAALRTFGGVEHRLESLGTRDGVLYVNDSKATNVASTLTALAAYADQPIHLILGGQGKGQDFTPLREPAARCAGVYLIGEDGPLIGAAIGRGEDCRTLDRAVAAARAAARPGELVLLSPACASFDQFADFEDRGRAFKEIVG